VKPLILGHWGTTPGLNFIYAHLNRIIRKHELNIVCIAGTGHGGHQQVFESRDQRGGPVDFRRERLQNLQPKHPGENPGYGNRGLVERSRL
jgi:hypothetical protein